MIRVEKVGLAGFRGINTSREFKFDTGVTVLFGANGVGKTSVLQGVEWSLTGDLPYLSGSDFTKEDAIVNLFNHKSSAVETVLLEGENKIACTRTRKMAKSTSRGSSAVILKLGKKELHDDNAQDKIEELLGFSTADFSKVAYLHQESIKELLSVKPEERSRAIDKLLGTFEVRELAEALDAKRALTAKAKELQERIDSLNRDKIQFVINMRDRLKKKEEDIAKAGFRGPDLSLGAVVKEVVSMQSEEEGLAERYNAVHPAGTRPAPDLQELTDAGRSLESSLKALDRDRTKMHGETDKKKQALEAAAQNYRDSKSESDALSGLTVEGIESKEKELARDLGTRDAKSAALGKNMSDVISIQRQVSSSVRFLREREQEAQAIAQKYEKGADLAKLQESYGAEFDSATAALEGFSKLSQLTSLAVEYISSEKPDACPVCEQEIKYAVVLQSIQERAKTAVPAAMNELRVRQRDLERNLARVRQDQKDLKRIDDEGRLERQRLHTALAAAAGVLGREVDEGYDFDSKIGSLKEELNEQNDSVVEVRTGLERLKEERRSLTKAIEKLSRAEERLQALCETKSQGGALLSRAERVSEQLEESLKSYGEATEIDSLSARLGKAQLILDYLKDDQELRDLEERLPNITEVVKRLEAAKAGLAELAGSLGAIRQAALEYEEGAVTSELESLGEAINAYYSMLLGHPVFSEIALVIEKREPLIYSIKAEGKEGSTYIPTRFSNAQMNCVAIALFLANNQKLAANFGTVLMDDPSQSLDPDHKEALAKLVAKLAEDKQVVIATQDTEFKEFLTRECGRIRSYDFGTWSSDGPSIKE